MGKYFGTDGFRGEANVELTAEHAFKIGKFLGSFYSKKSSGEKCRIAIGKDTRRSSYMFEYALAAGITSTGADALLLHVTTTPSVSYVVRSEGLDCGIMISASHNVYTDNGIKIINAQGEKLGDDIIEKIENYLDGNTPELPFAKKNDIGRTYDFVAGRNRYIGYLISLPMHSFKNVKVGLDLANGAAFSIAKSVFDALGAQTFVINNNPNGNNINDNAGSTHIEVLQKFVKDNHLDIGFAFDGDADRCLAVDEFGNAVNGDQIMYICAKKMKEEGSLKDNTVVTTVMSNLGLFKAFEKIGIKTVITKVGDRYVYEKMQEGGYSLGGEQSGHIIFSKHATTGDGIVTSLKLMETVIAEKTTLSELTKEVPMFPQILKNVKVEDKNKVMEDSDVLNSASEVEKALGSDGRILLRQSGTEPLVRIMVEASDIDTCNKYVDQVYKVIEKKGYIVK